MKPIHAETKILFDAALIKKAVSLPTHTHYRKWLGYYLDFCFKLHHESANKDSLALFVQKLRNNNQNEQQRKQAMAAVSIYYKIKKIDQDKSQTLKNKNENISTKKLN